MNTNNKTWVDGLRIFDNKQDWIICDIKINPDDPRRGMFFVYISKDDRKAAMANAFEFKNDHRGLGMLLGYPECCVNAFVRNISSGKFLKASFKGMIRPL